MQYASFADWGSLFFLVRYLLLFFIYHHYYYSLLVTASLKMHHIMRPGVSHGLGTPEDQTRCVTRSGPGANERDSGR